jgi:hypothetical protein
MLPLSTFDELPLQTALSAYQLSEARVGLCLNKGADV